jgi:hypothetical protein
MMSHREPPATISLSYTLNLGNLSHYYCYYSIIYCYLLYFALRDGLTNAIY